MITLYYWWLCDELELSLNPYLCGNNVNSLVPWAWSLYQYQVNWTKMRVLSSYPLCQWSPWILTSKLRKLSEVWMKGTTLDPLNGQIHLRSVIKHEKYCVSFWGQHEWKGVFLLTCRFLHFWSFVDTFVSVFAHWLTLSWTFLSATTRERTPSTTFTRHGKTRRGASLKKKNTQFF